MNLLLDHHTVVNSPNIFKHKLHKHRLQVATFQMFVKNDSLSFRVKVIIAPQALLQDGFLESQLLVIDASKLLNPRYRISINKTIDTEQRLQISRCLPECPAVDGTREDNIASARIKVNIGIVPVFNTPVI